jgi:SAM-dependent methyltransferase
MNQPESAVKHWLRSSLGPLAAQVRCYVWDWRHGVRTFGNKKLRAADLLPSAADALVYGRQYMPTHPRLLRRILESLPLADGRYDFVDFGSGKGRVLLAASEYPLGSVTGIEFDRDLHRIADRNIARYRGARRCRSVQSVCMDARDFSFAPRESIYFFFSPFTRPLMEAILQKMSRSLREHPRDCFLVYVNPELAGFVDGLGCFELYRNDEYCRIWRSSTSEAAGPPIAQAAAAGSAG